MVYTLEEEGSLLVLHLTGTLTREDLQGLLPIVNEHLAGGVRQVLMLHCNSLVNYDFDAGKAFGNALGDMLARGGVVIAVVKGRDVPFDFVIDVSVFNKGVIIGEFDEAADARAWLAARRQSDAGVAVGPETGSVSIQDLD